MPTTKSLFPGFYKILERPVPGFLHFFREEAGWNLIPFPVIYNAFAAKPLFFTGISAAAVFCIRSFFAFQKKHPLIKKKTGRHIKK